tara:strand:+ start:527 stop:1417 length:891 start_codon:yes stop_codon:yes gene_type:complete
MSDATGEYLARIGKISMLVPSEELELGRIVQANIHLENRSRAQERQLQKAKDRMVESNLRLVVSIAKKFAKYVPPSELLDLIQAGNTGLIRAVEKFNPSLGYRFSTYSYWWIQQAITFYLNTYKHPIRLPTSQHERLRKLEKYYSMYEQGRVDDHFDDILSDLKLTKDEAARLLRFKTSLRSLDALAVEDGTPLVELIAAREEPEEDDQVTRLKETYSSLAPEQREVIDLYYINRLSIKEVANMLGKSCEVINRIKASADFKISLIVNGIVPATEYIVQNDIQGIDNTSYEQIKLF